MRKDTAEIYRNALFEVQVKRRDYPGMIGCGRAGGAFKKSPLDAFKEPTDEEILAWHDEMSENFQEELARKTMDEIGD